jgi:hypothetical protein
MPTQSTHIWRQEVTVASSCAVLRRESRAVICRVAVFRRDARPLIGAFETSLASGPEGIPETRLGAS